MQSAVEQARLKMSRGTEAQTKSRLGQFFTPQRTARFMAGLFAPTPDRECRLLDPGAGIGSLSGAFLERCLGGELSFDSVDVTAFEIDNTLHAELSNTLAAYARRLPLRVQVYATDFIEEAVNRLQFFYGARFTHAILNPPYKKINSHSQQRLSLRAVGIETVNLYSAFVALALELMETRGQVVAIIPRSFCNGPYYRPFRDLVLARAAIRQIHLFDSRTQAFKDDGVLQENVVIALERGGAQGDVIVSTSTDDSYADLASQAYPFDRIVSPDDPQRFIRIPTSLQQSQVELSPTVRYSLQDLGIEVSTGPVVDFRLREHLRDRPEAGSVPLLYPGHFRGQHVEWPKPSLGKPNAIMRNADTEKWLYPSGFYCVVRRFSSKEERRRIVASIVRPASFPGMDAWGFENHLNVFHEHKRGLSEPLAQGLAVFLNTTAVDQHFRRFNGHTQVNATDLRSMKYPSRAALMALGEWAMRSRQVTQAMIDGQLDELVA